MVASTVIPCANSIPDNSNTSEEVFSPAERKELGRVPGDWPVMGCLVGRGSIVLSWAVLRTSSCLLFLCGKDPGEMCRVHSRVLVLPHLALGTEIPGIFDTWKYPGVTERKGRRLL